MNSLFLLSSIGNNWNNNENNIIYEILIITQTLQQAQFYKNMKHLS